MRAVSIVDVIQVRGTANPFGHSYNVSNQETQGAAEKSIPYIAVWKLP